MKLFITLLLALSIFLLISLRSEVSGPCSDLINETKNDRGKVQGLLESAISFFNQDAMEFSFLNKNEIVVFKQNALDKLNIDWSNFNVIFTEREITYRFNELQKGNFKLENLDRIYLGPKSHRLLFLKKSTVKQVNNDLESYDVYIECYNRYESGERRLKILDEE